jgi:hypothetical protein
MMNAIRVVTYITEGRYGSSARDVLDSFHVKGIPEEDINRLQRMWGCAKKR